MEEELGFDPKDEREYAQRSRSAFQEKFLDHPEIYGEIQSTVMSATSPGVAPDGRADLVVTFRNVHNWVPGGYAEKAFADVGLADIGPLLEGPRAVVTGGANAVDLAKSVHVSSTAHKSLKIVGGAVDGVVVGRETIMDLALLPSREELIGKITGGVLAVAVGAVALALSPARAIASQISEIAGGEDEGAGQEEAA